METFYIYKICCDDVDDFYIGSTQSIRHRKYAHKTACNGNKETMKGYNYKIYQTIRANGGWDKWRMVVIEEMINTTRVDATIREEFYRVELSPTMNMIRAYRSDEQRKEENKKKKKKWDENNKEHKHEYHKKYREAHREENNRKARDYRETHHEERLRKQREYTQTHRNEINIKQRERRARKKADNLLQYL